MRPFEIGVYILLVVEIILFLKVVEINKQLSFAESLICQDALMESVYNWRFP
jgi:hypothetical protein